MEEEAWADHQEEADSDQEASMVAAPIAVVQGHSVDLYLPIDRQDIEHLTRGGLSERLSLHSILNRRVARLARVEWGLLDWDSWEECWQQV